MMQSHYPASYHFDSESDAWQITFRDFPEQKAACYSRDDVELEAQDNLLLAIANEMIEGRTIPEPSALQTNELAIHIPVLVALKIALHNVMLTNKTSKAELARKLGFNGAQLDRLLDITYASKAEALEQALYLLGYEIRTSIERISTC